MVPQFDFSKIIEGVTAVLVGPVILTVAEGINQPLVKSTIKEGITFSERSQEAIAEVRERFEDLVAEVQAELAEERQAKPDIDTKTASQSQTATGVMSAIASLNEQIGQMTNGVADLRLLLPLGFGALALRQVLDKGFELEEIPWYTLAWYAFDSFVKLHDSGAQPANDQTPAPEVVGEIPAVEIS